MSSNQTKKDPTNKAADSTTLIDRPPSQEVAAAGEQGPSAVHQGASKGLISEGGVGGHQQDANICTITPTLAPPRAPTDPEAPTPPDSATAPLTAEEAREAVFQLALSKFGHRLHDWVKFNPGKPFPIAWRGHELVWLTRKERR